MIHRMHIDLMASGPLYGVVAYLKCFSPLLALIGGPVISLIQVRQTRRIVITLEKGNP